MKSRHTEALRVVGGGTSPCFVCKNTKRIYAAYEKMEYGEYGLMDFLLGVCHNTDGLLPFDHDTPRNPDAPQNEQPEGIMSCLNKQSFSNFFF